MNTLFQQKQNHSESCYTVKKSWSTAKIHFANEGSGLPFSSTDLGLFIFGSNHSKEFGMIMRIKGPHTPEAAYDIVHIHSLMIYTDLIEHNIDGNKKIPLLRCFLFDSKLKAGDIITTGQHMNYQTFSNLQFRSLLKNSFFIVISLTSETRAVAKYPMYVSVLPVLFRCLKEPPTFFSNLKDVRSWLLQKK